MAKQQAPSVVQVADSGAPRNPNMTADAAYYAPRGASAINNRNAMTRRGRPGGPLQTARTPVQLAGDTNTDQYYRSGGSARSQMGQPKGPVDVPMEPLKRMRDGTLVPADSRRDPRIAGQVYQAAGAGDVVTPIRVKDKSGVTAAADAIFAALADGGTHPIYVEVFTPECERRIQAAIDLGIARSRATEEQAQRIKLVPAVKDGADLARQMFGKVRPPPIVEEPDSSAVQLGDFSSFVKGGEGMAEDDSVPVSTGRSLDPVVTAAHNAMGLEGERPHGPIGKGGKRPKGKKETVQVQTVPTQSAADEDPVVAAAKAESAEPVAVERHDPLADLSNDMDEK
jgi:hypothetical protein